MGKNRNRKQGQQVSRPAAGNVADTPAALPSIAVPLGPPLVETKFDKPVPPGMESNPKVESHKEMPLSERSDTESSMGRAGDFFAPFVDGLFRSAVTFGMAAVAWWSYNVDPSASTHPDDRVTVILLYFSALFFLVEDWRGARECVESYRYKRSRISLTRLYLDFGIIMSFFLLLVSANRQDATFLIWLASAFALGGVWLILMNVEYTNEINEAGLRIRFPISAIFHFVLAGYSASMYWFKNFVDSKLKLDDAVLTLGVVFTLYVGTRVCEWWLYNSPGARAAFHRRKS